MRRNILDIFTLAAVALMLPSAAQAGSVLRVAMTLADIPLTTGFEQRVLSWRGAS